MLPSRREVLSASAAAGVLGSLHLLGAGAAVADDATALTDLERREPERLLAVVTKRRALEPATYAPDDLVPWRDGPYELRAEVAERLDLLFRAAERADVGLRVISGYRSFDTQAGTYAYWVARNGRAHADASSARPGHSEHQTGLAVDVDALSGECYLQACFGQSRPGRWVAREAHRFGFVLSYPQGAEDRTGYMYEPWHLRYVGPRVAGAMHRLGIELLPEYIDSRWVSADLGIGLGRHE